VVGGADDQRLVGQPAWIERVEHRANALIQNARARLKTRHVLPRLRRIDQWSRRARVTGVLAGARLREWAMCLPEANGEEEGLLGRVGQESGGSGDDVLRRHCVADEALLAHRIAARRAAL